MAPHSGKSIYNTPEHSLVMKMVVMAPHSRTQEGKPVLNTASQGHPASLNQKLKFKTIKIIISV